MRSKIQQHLLCHPWRDTVHWFNTIGSTNDLARQMARDGAPAGTMILAGKQTNGHGRMGRGFCSPEGSGVYLSCILRPNCKPAEVMHLTCAAAVAAASAVADASGITPGIKWTNDLVIGSKKLGGILTSLQIDPKTGLVDHAIIGIGINCLQQESDFPEELRPIACSLAMHTDKTDPATVAAALIRKLEIMNRELLTDKQAIMAAYTANCITLGREISWAAGEKICHGTAIDLDEDGGLILRLSDGQLQTAAFGEVSIRGMYGYI